MRIRFAFIILLATFFIVNATFFASADTIILNDGRKIEGVIQEEKGDFYIIKIKIGTVKIEKSSVKEIKKAATEEATTKTEKIKQDLEQKRLETSDQKNRDFLENKEKIKKAFGFELDLANGQIIITQVDEGGRAKIAGLKSSDIITQINEFQTKGKSAEETSKYLAKWETNSYNFIIQRVIELERKKIDYENTALVGVGIFLDTALDGGLIVNSVLKGTPAETAGIMPNDRLIFIDGKSTAGLSVDEAASLIGGAESSKFRVAIQRPIHVETE